ncbi:hypothetical protein M7I_4776 [Glarea lozoyensis 74030]|uniref:Uncharacterized protein n=1 Tax=Glarea lozoyensis (strain ATCC 74030 / MF5533) TaxID=1104152 RepID=H0EQ33_GLAL7|nr:hypothetical protein M7I_4776 [Glarea lozoyensis 74030]
MKNGKIKPDLDCYNSYMACVSFLEISHLAGGTYPQRTSKAIVLASAV